MNNRAKIIALAASLYMGWAAGAFAMDRVQAEQLFAHRIQPLIESRCLACHGKDPAKLKGGLDLRDPAAAARGGDSGPALVPAQASASAMYRALDWEDADLQMPPKENDRLSADEIDLIRQWIDAGAPWPDAEKRQLLRSTTKDTWLEGGKVSVPTSGGLSAEWTNRKYLKEDLWAYQVLTKPEVPEAVDHPIDWFLASRMAAIGVESAPAAGRRTLIRRATFDLLGLPPSPKEIANFLEDPKDDEMAFATVVERLLASPHYGERWGRHWLDVVRYADTAGFSNDFDRGNAWRYRDYVVRSFNQDKAYDRFVREQLAGDELRGRKAENIVATGFLRMGPWELTSMQVKAVSRQQYLDDVVNSVGQTFLGHTLRCAKCHDHKFDPIPTRDYYAMYAVFQGTQLSERRAPFFLGENTDGFEEKEPLLSEQKRVQQQLDDLNAKMWAAEKRWFEDRGLLYRTRKEAQEAGAPPQHIPPKYTGFTVADFGLERMARKTLLRLKWKLGRYERVACAVYNGVTPIRENYMQPMHMPGDPMSKGIREFGWILTGGDVFSRGPSVLPGTLSVINRSVPTLGGMRFPDDIIGRRTALAEWIVHPKNPLTWRAIANRIWAWHFGSPLAGNPNNLGATGKRPTHPQLLDWLAVTFLESGGSFKEMHRIIMSSAAYCRASDSQVADSNTYEAFVPRRLSAEELRDCMLKVTGELNPTIGGIPNRPEINLEVALQPRMVMGTFATAWQPNPLPEQRHRRSIYAQKIRGMRDPFMEVFNAPNPDLSCEAREASIVTPQVFSLFNSSIIYDRAVAFALRLRRESEVHGNVVVRAFQLAYGRDPDLSEAESANEHLRKMTERHRSFSLAKPKYPTEVRREAVEENTGEKFHFTERLDMFGKFVPDKKMSDVGPETRGLAELCLVLFNSNEFAYVY